MFVLASRNQQGYTYLVTYNIYLKHVYLLLNIPIEPLYLLLLFCEVLRISCFCLDIEW